MSDITPKRRGRPRNPPEDDPQRRHNEELERHRLADKAKESMVQHETTAINPDAQWMAHEPDKPVFESAAVIQVKAGPWRGSTWQVGEMDGEILYCYSLRTNNEVEFADFKVSDCLLIGNPVKGVGWVAYKYNRQRTPTWKKE